MLASLPQAGSHESAAYIVRLLFALTSLRVHFLLEAAQQMSCSPAYRITRGHCQGVNRCGSSIASYFTSLHVLPRRPSSCSGPIHLCQLGSPHDFRAWCKTPHRYCCQDLMTRDKAASLWTCDQFCTAMPPTLELHVCWRLTSARSEVYVPPSVFHKNHPLSAAEPSQKHMTCREILCARLTCRHSLQCHRRMFS